MIQQAESDLRQHGLNLTDYILLMSLILSPDGARPVGNLARTLLLHTTTATAATDRLEIRSLLVRRSVPNDRRTTLVSITDAGRELGRTATASLRAVDFGLGTRGAPEQHELIQLLTALNCAPANT
jgi:DNA-binding MarR family transcriptional regulator